MIYIDLLRGTVIKDILLSGLLEAKRSHGPIVKREVQSCDRKHSASFNDYDCTSVCWRYKDSRD